MSAFRRLQPCITLAVGLGMLICAQTCSAQVQRYQPNKPTTSPYLNLTRLNNGAVPNYYSLVRPQQQQQNLNLQERALRRQQAGALGRLEREVRLGQSQVVTTGVGSRFLTPGTRSSYLNTSRFYAQPVTERRLGR